MAIFQATARRFVLGKQGLWAGRRWKGKKGTAQAIHICEAAQLDPLNVTARSQDIVLHSQVMEYKPGYLYQVAYKHREFFDYGGWPAIYPMSELPFFSVHMEKRSHDKRVGDFKLSSPDHLVARLDPKLDRTTMTLEIKGFWHEDDAPVKNVDFANALAKGLIRFLNFVGAKKITTNAIRPAALRKQVEAILKAGV